MDLRPCDLCGSLVSIAAAPARGESLICEACLSTRRVRMESALPGGEPRPRKHKHKFPCLYCGRKLRSKPVKREVDVACPACNGVLVVGPGGTVRRHTAPPDPPPAQPLDHPLTSSDASEETLFRLHESHSGRSARLI